MKTGLLKILAAGFALSLVYWIVLIVVLVMRNKAFIPFRYIGF